MQDNAPGPLLQIGGTADPDDRGDAGLDTAVAWALCWRDH